MGVEAILHAGTFWALVSAFLWACAVILFKLAGESIPPLALNLYKGIVALFVFVPLMLLTGQGTAPDWPAHTWLTLVFSGVVGIAVADTLFFMALNRLGAGLNAVVTCLYFPVIAVMANVALGEELKPTAFAGGALVVIGILVGSDWRPARSPRSPERSSLISGIGYGLLALLTMGVGVVAMKPVLVDEPILWTTSVRLVAGVLALVPVVWFGPDRPLFVRLLRPSRLWRYALPGAVLGGALSMLAWVAGFALTDATRAAILNQLSTIFVFILAAVVLKEPVSPRRVAAIGLAFGGALLVMIGQ